MSSNGLRYLAIDEKLYRFGLHIGPWLVTLSAAMVFGAAYTQATEAVLGPLAWAAGCLAALGLELTGLLFFHLAAMNLRAGRAARAALAGSIGGVGYLLIGLMVVNSLKGGFNWLYFIPYVLVVCMNIARAMGHDLEKSDNEAKAEKMATAAKESEAGNRQHKLDVIAAKAEAAAIVEAARIEAEGQAAAKLAKEESNRLARLARIEAARPESAKPQPGHGAARAESEAARPLPALTDNEAAALEFINGQAGIPTGRAVADELGLTSDRTGRKLIAALKEKGVLNGHDKS